MGFSLTNLFQPTYDRSKDASLELAMEVDGHRLYKYRSINHLPLLRETVVRVGYVKMECGVRPEDSLTFCKMQSDAFNAGNVTEATQLLGFYQRQVQEFGSQRAALEIGGYAVLVDDEQHHETTQDYNELKARLCEKYSTVRLFFLSESVGYVTALNSSIEASLLMGQLTDPTRQQREREFLRSIRQPLCDGLWTVLTPPPSGWQRKLAAILQKT
ncbi:hypothetical protein LEM8419_03568 [Neolewinella maritima]|uniref:Uncharacterized protein n=1 Tax=Neolewinella maritima TaxID=1383882 RepID=A0ABM9B5Q2_9BACT|nr:hypothetical protein [Neolewinella maritima]CAH1002696.1 hypothetical protein LEM8419_03568 [Neolewinella maritima]